MAYDAASGLGAYFNYLGLSAANFIVALIVVIVFLAVGYIVALIVNFIVKKLLYHIRLEDWIKKHELQGAIGGFTITQIVSVLLKVYIVFAFLGAAAQLINLSFFSTVVGYVLNYLASLAQGIALIIAILFVATYITNTIRKAKHVFMSEQIAVGVQILITYIAVILALPLFLPNLGAQVQILSRILELLITAIILAFGLAVGLGFGLGLKDSIAKAAAKNQDIFDNMMRKFQKK